VTLEEMSLQRLEEGKTLRAVSARVGLGSGVYADVAFQLAVAFEQLSAVRTVVRPPVVVQSVVVPLQMVRLGERFVAQGALEGSVSRVHSHVPVQVSPLRKRLLAHATFVRFISTVSSAVNGEIVQRREAFAANGTLE